MKLGNYEITIRSDNPEVQEMAGLDGPVWIGFLGATYSVQIRNYDQNYRIWAQMYIDGNPVMRDGWGRLAEPESSLKWVGFQIDDTNVREFIFSEDSNEVAEGRQGFIDIRIEREKIAWDELSPPAPVRTMGFMTTGMGNFRESRVKVAKVKFRFGGPQVQVSIPYGSISDLVNRGLLAAPVGWCETANNIVQAAQWLRLRIERTTWDSFSVPPNRRLVSEFLLHPDGTVFMRKDCKKRDYKNIDEFKLLPLMQETVRQVIQEIASDPITARRDLDSSPVVNHVGHHNGVSVLLERFKDKGMQSGDVVLKWEGNAMIIEGGLLEKLANL